MVRQTLLLAAIGAHLAVGCFSSAKTNKTESPNAMEMNGNSVSHNERQKSNDRQMVNDYLDAFGYLSAIRLAPKQSGTLEEEALKEFQRFVGVNPSGQLDTMTKSAMMRKRCANSDLHPKTKPTLWEKTSLSWRIGSFPIGLRAADVKELVSQAFKAWEIVIAIDFVEAPVSAFSADIVFEFSERNPMKSNDRTGLSVGAATRPVNSRIWIKRSERWGTFQKQENGRLDIFLTIVHEIGHVLGLEHSNDQSSVMFPIFQRQNGEELPVINADDVEHLRALYDPPTESGPPIPDPASATDSEHEKCPTALWSITETPSGRLVVFVDDVVYRFGANRSLISGPEKIQKVFPGAPTRIAVAVSDRRRVALIEERLIYAYEENEVTGVFSLLSDYPKRLHSRVLFFPSAAFPLSNGSVILLDGGVFATYSLERNSPSFLNDKDLFFPHLPEGLRSGIAARESSSDQLFEMFTSDAVHKYDLSIKQTVAVRPLTSYLHCKP